MTKRFFLITLLAILMLAMAAPVYARAVGAVYVDLAWTGSEDGSQAKPYNTEQEGINAAHAMRDGAYVYIKQADGTWGPGKYYAPTYSGPYGTPIPTALLYTLLAILALGLIGFGWQLQRRSKQLRA